MSITKGIYLATVFVVSLSFAAANLNAQNAFNQISNENIQELLPEVQEWNESASANQQGNVDNLLGRFDDPENSDDVDFIDDDLGDQNQNLFGNDNSNGQGNAFESNPFGDNDGGFALDGDSQGNANSLDEENLFGGNETVGNTSGNEIDLTDSEPVNFGNNQQYVNLNNQQYVNLNNTEPLGIQLPEGVSIDQDSPLFRGAKRPGTRRILSPGEAPFEYTVKPGDTLYDICDQLIDDTNFWPKLWAANPQIHNPHFIRPGMRLRFYPGLGNPSAIADAHIKKYGSLSSVPPEAYAALNKTQASDAKAPPPAEVPKTQHVFEPAEIVTYIGKENFDEPKRLRIPSFITSTFDKDKLVYGKALGGVEGQYLRGSRELVLVKPSKGLKQGMSITFVRKEKLPFQTHKLKGRQVYKYMQHGEIVGKAEGSDLYIARIDPGFGEVHSGDWVVPFRNNYRLLEPKISKEKKTAIEDMYVIYFGSRIATQGGQGQFVYFDKGTSAGVKPGQQVEITSGFGRFAPRDLTDKYPKNKPYQASSSWTPSIAVAEIIDVAPDSSIGFILYSTREVELGDRVSTKAENTAKKKL